jgi:hypothetical protein
VVICNSAILSIWWTLILLPKDFYIM